MKIRFFSKNATRAKKREIWSGIVHKTKSNGDYSLSQIYFRSISSSRK